MSEPVKTFRVRIARPNGVYTDGVLEITLKLQRIVIRYGQSIEVGRIIYFSFIMQSEYTLSNSRRICHLSLTVTDPKTPLQTDKLEFDFLNSGDLQTVLQILRQGGIASSSSRAGSVCISFDSSFGGETELIPSLIRYKGNDYNVKAALTHTGVEFRAIDTGRVIVEIRKELVCSCTLSLDERSVHISLSTGREFDIFAVREGIHRIMETLSPIDLGVGDMMKFGENNGTNQGNSFFGSSVDYSFSSNTNNQNKGSIYKSSPFPSKLQNQETILRSPAPSSPYQIRSDNNNNNNSNRREDNENYDNQTHYQQQELRFFDLGTQQPQQRRNSPMFTDGRNEGDFLRQHSPQPIYIAPYSTTSNSRSVSFSKEKPLPRYMQQTESSNRKARAGSALRDMSASLNNSTRKSSIERYNNGSYMSSGRGMNRINSSRSREYNPFDSIVGTSGTSRSHITDEASDVSFTRGTQRRKSNGLELLNANTSRSDIITQRSPSPSLSQQQQQQRGNYTLVLNLPSGDVVRLPFSMQNIIRSNGQLIVNWKASNETDGMKGYGLFSIE